MPQHPVEISLLCSHPRSTRTSPRRTQRILKVCATPRSGRGARARRQVGRMITLYTVTLTVACCVAVALVVVSERRTRTADARWATTSTFAVLAASCATLSSLAYAMSGPDGENLMPLVIGDVSMPLSIGLILAAVRRAAGRKRTLVILSVTLSIAVGRNHAAGLARCGPGGEAAGARRAQRPDRAGLPAQSPPPARSVAGRGDDGDCTGSTARCASAVPLVIGTDHRYVRFAFERGPSTIAAAIAVALVAWGMIVIIRRSQAPEPTAIVSNATLTNWIEALLAQRDVVLAVTISVPALPLHRAAFGRPWAQAIDDRGHAGRGRGDAGRQRDRTRRSGSARRPAVHDDVRPRRHPHPAAGELRTDAAAFGTDGSPRPRGAAAQDHLRRRRSAIRAPRAHRRASRHGLSGGVTDVHRATAPVDRHPHVLDLAVAAAAVDRRGRDRPAGAGPRPGNAEPVDLHDRRLARGGAHRPRARAPVAAPAAVGRAGHPPARHRGGRADDPRHPDRLRLPLGVPGHVDRDALPAVGDRHGPRNGRRAGAARRDRPPREREQHAAPDHRHALAQLHRDQHAHRRASDPRVQAAPAARGQQAERDALAIDAAGAGTLAGAGIDRRRRGAPLRRRRHPRGQQDVPRSLRHRSRRPDVRAALGRVRRIRGLAARQRAPADDARAPGRAVRRRAHLALHRRLGVARPRGHRAAPAR